jgi:hypothetical protein
VRFFVKSAGVLLLITALAKIVSAFGSTKILDTHDPVLAIPFRYEFLIVGTIEVVIAYVCLFKNCIQRQLWSIAWLATNFAVYRVGFWSVHYQPCPCLGSLPDAIHLSPQTANSIVLGILIYLLMGSYALLYKWYANSAQS